MTAAETALLKKVLARLDVLEEKHDRAVERVARMVTQLLRDDIYGKPPEPRKGLHVVP